MKNKLYILLIIFISFVSIRITSALSLDDTIQCENVGNSTYITYPRYYYYSIKQNKPYVLTPCSNSATISIREAMEEIKDNLLEGELNGIEYLGIYHRRQIYFGHKYYLVPINNPKTYYEEDFNISYNLSTHEAEYAVDPAGTIIEKGSIFLARNIIINEMLYEEIFYADKNYIITNVYGSDYNIYFILEEAPNQPKEPDNSVSSNNVDNNKLDLECLSDEHGKHNCELYYIYQKAIDNMPHQISFRLSLNNLQGQIIINDKTEEINSDKEYTFEAKCEEDSDTCKVLAARLITENIDSTKTATMTIIPVNLKIDEETHALGIDNNKCTYSKVIKNPKTSTYNILFVALALIVSSGLLFFLKKKEILKKI